MVIYAALLMTALVTALVITPEVVRTSHRVGLLDKPAQGKIHTVPVPRLGGVAIAFALALTLGVAVLIDAQAASGPSPDPKSLLPILSGAALVFAVGLWDDIDPRSPEFKLLAECAAAAIVIGSGLSIASVTLFGTTYELGWMAIPITGAWVVLITNAFNLMDGLDGLAGGLIAIAAATCATVLMYRGEQPSAMLLVSLVGAVLGFLAYNFHPARIFMGDSGSLLAGFLLAVTAITGRQKGATTLAVSVPLLIFAVPLGDTLVAIGRRLLSRHSGASPGQPGVSELVRRVLTGDREHVHHRLLEAGLSHRAAVLTLYGLMILCSILALLTMEAP